MEPIWLCKLLWIRKRNIQYIIHCWYYEIAIKIREKNRTFKWVVKLYNFDSLLNKIIVLKLISNILKKLIHRFFVLKITSILNNFNDRFIKKMYQSKMWWVVDPSKLSRWNSFKFENPNRTYVLTFTITANICSFFVAQKINAFIIIFVLIIVFIPFIRQQQILFKKRR